MSVIEITAQGIAVKSFDEIYAENRQKIQEIYGQDVYIEPDSQDGQMLAIWSLAQSDTAQAIAAVFNAFSPTYSFGEHLSSLVRINGLKRSASSKSTATGTITGVAGTVLNQCSVKDVNGNIWDISDGTVIPPSGEITVTVTCRTDGDIRAPAGSINEINTPIRGWQSFVSTADAASGSPVEEDAVLRVRQGISTNLPSLTQIAATHAAVANLPGVTRVRTYENNTSATDENGIPGRSICVVVRGGDVRKIAETIGQKKSPGAGTYGSEIQEYADPTTGIQYGINFFILDDVDVYVNLTLSVNRNYNSGIGDAIRSNFANYINNREIGEDVEYKRLYCVAFLGGTPEGFSYELESMTLSVDGTTFGTDDISIPFNMTAACDPENVVITLVES